MKDLSGRTAVITGGAQGIGLGIAHALGRAGVKIALVDVNGNALESAVAQLSNVATVVAKVLDVRDRAAFTDVANDIEAQLGPVSLLFNNAGIATRVTAEAMSYESWDWVMGINLGGVINGIQTFLPRMLARGGEAHIVNTSSGAGVISEGGGYLYHGSKFAVVGLSEALREELAPHQIGISVLLPGPVATGIIANSAALAPSDVTDGGDAVVTWQRVVSAAMNEGVSPLAVGDMVVAAILDNRSPYIFTDDSLGAPIQARTAKLLDALPAKHAEA
jgi:NAD(P)-dependent dehydrogenase (short-subunit alcohol dehydrogenase family)